MRFRDGVAQEVLWLEIVPSSQEEPREDLSSLPFYVYPCAATRDSAQVSASNHSTVSRGKG